VITTFVGNIEVSLFLFYLSCTQHFSVCIEELFAFLLARLILFCSLVSVVVCNASGGRAGRAGGRHSTAGQSCYVPLWRHLVIF